MAYAHAARIASLVVLDIFVQIFMHFVLLNQLMKVL
jgi:hypothetical protein